MTETIRLSGSCEIVAASGDAPRRLAIVAYTGGLMTVDSFGVVALDLSGMTLPSTLPILSDHSNSIASVVASGTPRITGGSLTITATLADSDAARSVVSLLASGVSLQASVGASPVARRFVPAGEAIQANNRSITSPAGGFTFVERSVLREISVVPVGADSATAVSLAASLQRGSKMSDDIQAAIATERERLKKIDQLCRGFDGDQRIQAARAEAIEGTLSFEGLQSACLEQLRASRPAPSFSHSPGGIRHADVETKDVLTAAMMIRAGFSKAAEQEFGSPVLEASRPLQSASLVDLCRAGLHGDGRMIPSNRNEMIKAAVSSGSMSYALGNTANRILQTAYRTAPAAWRSFAAVKSSSDFKINRSIRPSFPGDLLELPPGGEIKHASIQEEVYSWTLGQYARQLQIDRTQIVNDDLHVFNEVVPSMAKAAARTLSGLVATTILANSGSFWSTGNANYFEGAATLLQASSLATAIKTLRQQKDAENNILDLTPHCLLVPPELEQTAKALVASAELQRYVTSGTDQQPMGNPFLDVASVAVEPRLSDSSYTGYSTTAWYLFSSPDNAAVVVGFLDAMEAPTIETFGLDHDIDHLSMGFRVYHDFAVALADYRASVMSKGAA